MPQPQPTTVAWKPNWTQARENWTKWWNQQGLAVSIPAPLDQPRLDIENPTPPTNHQTRNLDPEYRAAKALYQAATTYYGGDAVPMARSNIGAGDLTAMLGSDWRFAESTVWFNPCINDRTDCPQITFDSHNKPLQQLLAIINATLQCADGRFLVGSPDLVENFDVLASLRGSENLLYDTIDDSKWVSDRIEDINQAYFQAFDIIFDVVKDESGGNVNNSFNIWGPGKTEKVQCDAAPMLSQDMFRQFVVPALTRQCDWLDYSMFHLDGEDALIHLDALLEIESLNAIEWTPIHWWNGEDGGHPKWYDLYRKILAAGKSVQALQVRSDRVIPLLDAVGSKGMMILTYAKSETEARKMEQKIEGYY